MFARAGIEILADRLVERDVDRHTRIGEIPLGVCDPVVDIIRPQSLVNPLQLRGERLWVAGRSIAANQVALHAIVVVGDDLHRSVEVAGVGLFDGIQRTLVEPRIVDIRIVSTVHGREVIHERRCLR